MASRSYLCLLAFHQDSPDYHHHPAAGRDLPVREAHYQDLLYSTVGKPSYLSVQHRVLPST